MSASKWPPRVRVGPVSEARAPNFHHTLGYDGERVRAIDALEARLEGSSVLCEERVGDYLPVLERNAQHRKDPRPLVAEDWHRGAPEVVDQLLEQRGKLLPASAPLLVIARYPFVLTFCIQIDPALWLTCSRDGLSASSIGLSSKS